MQCAGFHAMRGYLEIVNTEGVDPELVKRCQMVVDGSRQPNWFSSMDEAERVYQLGLGPSKSARG
ncbi:MAG TPA: hypothetical protein DCS05_12615 [Nitrospiraceae bacterium]|nr:hypothetical protein [Nitrospiraceae bacterium]